MARRVLAAGGSVEQAQAALLHDTIEDQGPSWWPDIRAFGATVASIVHACSDAETVGNKKAPWIDRKTEHVGKLAGGVVREAYLVVAADKLDAVDRTLAELVAHGASFWSKGVFKGGRLGTVWYYTAMSAAVSQHLPENALAAELATQVARLRVIADLDGVEEKELLAMATVTRWPDGIKAGDGGPA